jgi:hydantoinase/carbamoylase family amidase
MRATVMAMETDPAGLAPMAVQEMPVEDMASQVMARCDVLAAITSAAPAIRRTFLTPEHRAANDQVAAWMRAAGMQVRVDAIGTVIGRHASDVAQAPVLLIGSHLDTVPDAGRYDGPLGVLLGIAAVECLRASGVRLPFHVDVIGFGDEEGVRFGATLLSSRALAGTWDDAWLALQDADGVTLAQALRTFGLDPDAVASAAIPTEALLGYLEVHIEQGPVLEALALPVGIVTAIAGTRRLLVDVRGQAGHAGTVPMDMRRDALVGAALGVALLESTAIARGVTATSGRITCLPGGVNVIPGDVTFSVDIRSGDDARRDAALDAFRAGFADLCEARGLQHAVREIHHADAAPCTPWLQDVFAGAVQALGLDVQRLESGAGHDAMAMARACDIAMLFVRCKGGISHHPDESVTAADVAVALGVLLGALGELGRARTTAATPS